MPAINGSSALGHSYSLRSSSCIDGIGAKDNGFFIMPGDNNEGVEAQVQRMKGSRGRTSTRRKRFVGVRQRPSGRWVAEIKDTTQKIRMWLGTFETAEAAARAYDEAACLLRGSNTRTNFVTSVSNNSPLASRIRRLLSLRRDSNKSNNAAPPFIGSPSPRTDEEAPASCLRFDAPPGDPLLSPAESCISTTTEELDHPHPPPPTHNNLKPHGLDQTESYCDRQPPAPSISEFPLRGHFDHSRNYSFLNSSSASIDDDLPTFDANYADESSANTKSGENGSCFNINIDQYFSWPFDFGSDINMQLPTNYDFPLLNDLITLPLASDNGGSSSVESELCSEQTLGFKRMKFERRISASLYAINGVQECLQNFSQPSAEAHGCNTTTTSVFSSSSSSYNETYFNSGFWNRTGNSSSPGSESDEQQSHADVLWDLPPLCPLSCKS